jgi:protein phosphatase
VPLIAFFAGGAVTDIGSFRKENQDAVTCRSEEGLFVVSDGMGGTQGEQLASKIVVSVLPNMVLERMRRLRNPRDRAIQYWLKYEIRKLSRHLRSKSASEAGFRGMGATFVVALFRDNRVYIAHMGDSRVYLFRDAKLTQLTNDHSVVGVLVRYGEITPEEAEVHPARGNITRYIRSLWSVGKQRQDALSGILPGASADIRGTHLFRSLCCDQS